MKYLPQWDPNDGSGKGEPAYHIPPAAFSMSSIGSTMQITLLGTSYQLTQNQSNPLLYENTSAGITAQLSTAPLNDGNAQEYTQIVVSMPSAGIVNCTYDCDETTASSNSFENFTPGVVVTSVSGSSMSLKLYEDNFTTDFQLSSTATNTYSGGGLTAKVIGTSSGGLDIALTSAPRGLSNTVIHLSSSSGQYRNFDPPTPSSFPTEPVSDYASFYVQVPVNLAPQGQTPKIKLKMKVNGQDEEMAEVNLVSTGDNNWRTEKVCILSSLDASESDMTAQDQSDTQLIKVPEEADMDWKEGGGTVTVEYEGGTVDVPAQANGIVLQSLDFITKFGQGLNPENFIRKPFQDMGYTMYKDYNAPRNKTVDDYVKGKQIWYSMSHGATQDGTPQTEFGGLKFIDGFITASNLSSLKSKLSTCRCGWLRKRANFDFIRTGRHE